MTGELEATFAPDLLRFVDTNRDTLRRAAGKGPDRWIDEADEPVDEAQSGAVEIERVVPAELRVDQLDAAQGRSGAAFAVSSRERTPARTRCPAARSAVTG